MVVRAQGELSVNDLRAGHAVMMNIGRRSDGGSHWVMVYCTPADTIYYDSFAMPVPDHIRRALLQRRKPIYASTRAHQLWGSKRCGIYALAVGLRLHGGDDFAAVATEWLNANKPRSNAGKLRLFFSNLK